MANDVQFDDILDIDDWDAIASINGFSAQPLEALWGGPEVDIRSLQAYDVQGSIARGRDSGSTKGRGRLYTGCLTCRQRKIKCDERKPACGNCERSRHHVCRGYGSLGGYATRVGQIQRNQVQGRDCRISRSLTPGTRSHNSNEATTGRLLAMLSADGNGSRRDDDPDAMLDDDNTIRDVENTMAHVACPASAAEVGGEQETFIMAHYRDVVCHYMMPVIDGKRNPWSRLYLPLALGTPSSKSQLALRNALLAMASYHLAQNENQNSAEYLRCAECYHLMASDGLLQLSQQGVLDMEDHEKLALMSTAMALLSSSVFGADNIDCGIYLGIAKRLLGRTGGEGFWLSAEVTRSLVQILGCYDVLTSTTSITGRPLEGLSNGASGSELTQPLDSRHVDAVPSHFSNSHLSSEDVSTASPVLRAIHSGDHYILGISFGINRKTFSLLRRTVRMANTITLCGTESAVPDSVVDIAKVLRQELMQVDRSLPFTVFQDELSLLEKSGQFFPSGVAYCNEKTAELPPLVTKEILKNHQMAFHTAAIVYYYRVMHSIWGDPHCWRAQNSSDSTDCQDFVRRTLDYLETIECFTRDAETQPANTFWPAFIAAVEAVQVPLRHRAFIIMSRAVKKGLGNVIRAQEIVMETWRLTDRILEGNPLENGLGPIDWRKVMLDRDCKIMLT